MIAVSSLYVTIMLVRNAFKNLCLSFLSCFPLYPILILMCPFQLSYTYSLISISHSIKKFQPVFLFLFKDYLFFKSIPGNSLLFSNPTNNLGLLFGMFGLLTYKVIIDMVRFNN